MIPLWLGIEFILGVIGAIITSISDFMADGGFASYTSPEDYIIFIPVTLVFLFIGIPFFSAGVQIVRACTPVANVIIRTYMHPLGTISGDFFSRLYNSSYTPLFKFQDGALNAILSNEQVMIIYEMFNDKDKPIYVFENGNRRGFKVENSNYKIWHRLCLSFNYMTIYEDIYNILELKIKQEFDEKDIQKLIVGENSEENTDCKTEDLVDINNCSEADLIALPGIDLSMAKIIIKTKTSINGFRDVDDFIKRLNPPEEVAHQLRTKICVTESSDVSKLNNERPVDF